MSHRVKAGDLAVIVNSFQGYNDGKLVSVLRRMTAEEEAGFVRRAYGQLWLVESLGAPLTQAIENLNTGHVVRLEKVQQRGVHESILRPIRDPGEDATDEMVLIKPIPQKESV